jgi:membrane fusion protein (multidrug efflux system)
MNQPIETSISNELNSKNINNRKRRGLLFSLLALTVAVAGGGGWAYWVQVGSRHVSTDNAYTAAEVATVTAEIGGLVADVRVVDSQKVKRGDILVVLDDTDAKLSLAQAEAELGRAIRKVKGYEANDVGLGAQVTAHEAEQQRLEAQLTSAEADLERARIDFKRREALVASGSVSGDELTRTQNAYSSAVANLNAMKAAVAQAHASRNAALGSQKANAALIADSNLETNPEVALARARRDQAAVNLKRTYIRSPVDGVIARRQVQLGQHVQPSLPLLSVVPVQDMYVDANFKEVQLQDVQPGQKVELICDLYGEKVIFHGIVDGFNGGTGAAFALIPAQNATGNWIKVVQRLPVRIRLDAAELEAHPLRVGLSMSATVELRSKS